MSKAPLSTTQPAKTISISPLSYRPEIPGEERPEENILAEQALENMMGALERRKQKPFLDPTMLQLAAGFLAPTRTGSAFESIGNAARAYAGAKDLERQREAEDIAFETGVLGQASAIAQSRARDLAFRTSAEQDPRFGMTVKGSDVLTPEGLKEVVGNVPGVFVAPPNPNFPDSKSLLNSIWREGKKSHSEALKEIAELEYKRYDIKDGSVFDRRTGLGWKIPEGKREEFTAANGATYEIPAEDAVYLYHQQRYGKVKEYNERAKMLNLPLLPERETRVSEKIIKDKDGDKTIETITTKESYEPGKSKAQRDLDAEINKVLETERAKTSSKTEEEFQTKGVAAVDTINLGNTLIDIASDPEAPEIYGLARGNENVLAMLASLAATGIQLGGGYSLSVPEIEQLYLTYKLTKEQRQRFDFFLQAARQMAIKMSEFAKGSVSNYEQTLFSQASVNERDLPGTIRMKAQAMNARAKFESHSGLPTRTRCS